MTKLLHQQILITHRWTERRTDRRKNRRIEPGALAKIYIGIHWRSNCNELKLNWFTAWHLNCRFMPFFDNDSLKYFWEMKLNWSWSSFLCAPNILQKMIWRSRTTTRRVRSFQCGRSTAKLLSFMPRKVSSHMRYWSPPIPNLKYTSSTFPTDHSPWAAVTTNDDG